MLTVGQKLWFVPREHYLGAPLEVTVEKLGRTWATMGASRYRINIATLAMDAGDGYGSIGQCYVDREAYEAERNRQAAWTALRGRCSNWGVKLHPDVTLADIEHATKLLKL